MERQTELTYDEALEMVETEKFHLIGPFASACFQDISEYYKKLDNGLYAYIMAEDTDEEYCNGRIDCDVDTFLNYVGICQADYTKPSRDDIAFICQERPKVEPDLLNDYSAKTVKMLRLAIEDNDEFLLGRIVFQMKLEDGTVKCFMEK